MQCSSPYCVWSTLLKQVPTRMLTVSYNKPLSLLGPAWLNLCQTSKQKVQTKPSYILLESCSKQTKLQQYVHNHTQQTMHLRHENCCMAKEQWRKQWCIWNRHEDSKPPREVMKKENSLIFYFTHFSWRCRSDITTRKIFCFSGQYCDIKF